MKFFKINGVFLILCYFISPIESRETLLEQEINDVQTEKTTTPALKRRPAPKRLPNVDFLDLNCQTVDFGQWSQIR